MDEIFKAFASLDQYPWIQISPDGFLLSWDKSSVRFSTPEAAMDFYIAESFDRRLVALEAEITKASAERQRLKAAQARYYTARGISK